MNKGQLQYMNGKLQSDNADLQSRLTAAEKTLKRFPDYFAYEREYNKLEAKLTAAEKENKRLTERLAKVRTATDKKLATWQAVTDANADFVVRIKELEGAALNKNHCLYILAKCVAGLWHAVAGGMYDARGFVGDTVLPMQETLLEIGIDVREKPLNTEALKG